MTEVVTGEAVVLDVRCARFPSRLLAAQQAAAAAVPVTAQQARAAAQPPAWLAGPAEVGREPAPQGPARQQQPVSGDFAPPV